MGKIIVRILWVLLLAVTLSASSSVRLLSAAAAPEHIALTWTGDPCTTQTITWKTSAGDATAAMVQYQEAAAGPLTEQGKTFPAQTELLSTNLGQVAVHSATLTGLTPGKRYVYRVGDGAVWSEAHFFVTADKQREDFTFLVFGDSQSSNYNAWRDTLHNAYANHANAAFFTNVGDLVDVGQDYAQWKNWFTAAAGVIDAIPAMPAMGNHETYSPGARFSQPSLFTGQFMLPLNGPEGLLRQVYSFDYGQAHFVILDTQSGEQAQFQPNMLEREAAWLDEDLKNSQKKWKFVFLHKPPYDNRNGGNANIRAAFTPLFDKYHVDVVFSGHDHVYARTRPVHQGSIVDSPSGGVLYVATGRSGTKFYQDMVANHWDAFFYNPVDEPIYLSVRLHGNAMTVQAFRQSGGILDEWSVEK